MPNEFLSLETNQTFIYTLPQRFPSIRRSTLVFIPAGQLFGRVEGLLFFEGDILLCVQEYLNFELGVIEGYGYEVSRPGVSPDHPDFPDAVEYCRASYPHKASSTGMIRSPIQMTIRWQQPTPTTSMYLPTSNTIASLHQNSLSPHQIYAS